MDAYTIIHGYAYDIDRLLLYFHRCNGVMMTEEMAERFNSVEAVQRLWKAEIYLKSGIFVTVYLVLKKDGSSFKKYIIASEMDNTLFNGYLLLVDWELADQWRDKSMVNHLVM